jgi:hypothetical protein
MRQWNPMIPPALDAAVLHCLAKQPEARPANALDLAQELSAAIGRPFDGSGAFMRWREWSDSTSETTGLGRTAAGISGTRIRRTAVAPRRRRWLLAASALGFVMVAGLLALSFGRGSPKPAAPDIVPDVVLAPPTPAIAGKAKARIRLQSSPPGADLFDASGNKLGVTPLDIDLPQEVRHRVRFVREGYRPAERTILVDGDTTILVELKADPVRGRPAAASGREPGTAPPGSRTRKSVLKTGAGTINPFGP